MEETDIVLMARIRKGDPKAFELLFSRHQRPVYNLAIRFLGNSDDAEDIAQEAFIRIGRAAQTYTPDAKFTTWLYTIVRNLCFNAIRNRRSGEMVSIDAEIMPELPAREDDPVARISRQEIREQVIRAVGRLPDHMRMAVILSKYHDLPYEEIAAIMGCSVNAVKLRVFRAKALLAKDLAGLRSET